MGQHASPTRGAARALEGYNRGEATSARAVRKQRELSLRELEERTGINRAVWSQIETGQLLPSPRHIAALSRALDVPAEEWRIRFVLEREASA